jgi:aminopeptidase-like protein
MNAVHSNDSSSQPVSQFVSGEMSALMAELFPICRSITGDGLRQSLRILQRVVPLKLHEVASGTRVFDWTVPDEWNVRDAYVKNVDGEKVIDFQTSNLHLLNYSAPIHQTMPLAQLKPHLYSLSAQPDRVPYRTSYYQRNWGFCLSHRALQSLPEGDYEVCIDSSLEPGFMTYGEYCLAGETRDEVLISCHCCHPSLGNDNLSGMVLAALLARELGQQLRRYTYRFLFLPATIGAITWLALNEPQVAHIKHGLVVTCVGDPGKFTYKKSRRGNAEIDRAAKLVLAHSGQDYDIVDFSPYGYDERQYCSPGFNLPVGSLMRTPNGRYPEYHTSADNLDFVRPDCLQQSLTTYRAVLDVLEKNKTYTNTNPKCEPQLGRRGLYAAIGGLPDEPTRQMSLLWVLNLSDGQHSLVDIAERAGLAFGDIANAAAALCEADLLQEQGDGFQPLA